MFGPICRELQRGMWTNLTCLSMHRVCIRISQVEVPLWARPGIGIPSISTGCAQPRDPYAQGIHMFVHNKPVAAQWPPRSVAGRFRPCRHCSCDGAASSLAGSTPMAWRRLAGVAAAAQPKRGSDDPEVSDSIRTNGPYLSSEGSRSGYQPL